MKINLEIDESDIIRQCLKGLSKKEIKQKIINDVISITTDKISSKIYNQFSFQLSKKDVRQVHNIVKQDTGKIFNESVKKIIKEKLDDYKIENNIDEYLTAMIEEYFECSPVTIEFKHGKNHRKVDVLATKARK